MQALRSIERSGICGEPIACVGCEARARGVCGALAGDQLVSLSRVSDRRVIRPGEHVGRAAGESESVSNILSGVVSLAKRLPDGRQQIVGLQFAPTLVGRPIAGDDAIEATAAGPVRVCTIPRSAFEGVLTANQAFERRVLSQALSQLDETRDLLVTLARKTALERVATYINMVVRHARPVGSPGEPGEIPLPLSRGEMADFLGLTIETVSRKMTELRKAKIVDFANAASLRILSQTRLDQAAGG
ncbi:Crp/Fnr family transcriptional regulator [Antarcticirhabdus aurantiaca]|uniref:Crp/Fnr family transcriptional regulator n=1 Tax=Antarcticirhabdus aurantiaca TaxID=2606717 RepID=A0ACD4NRF3_9HYPH|nr:Crp/Fnr family transcriptional regulator [Antarcticirhabdus aurantiaca]WAJ29483.1 Crp/Fnr family transcriptional regulator [Jeongeuplla avenae]